MKKNAKVPGGLKKCQKCGYYRGWVEEDRGESNHGRVKASCSCHKQLCERCGEKVYEFPIHSWVYDEKRGDVLHVPVYCAWGHTCPDGVKGQLKNSFLIDPRTGEDVLRK